MDLTIIAVIIIIGLETDLMYNKQWKYYILNNTLHVDVLQNHGLHLFSENKWKPNTDF